MKSKLIRLIAAVDSKNGLAKNGKMPWDIPDDLMYFRRLTKTHGANVLMGYKTYQPIGHSLEDRHSYVLSRHNVSNPPKDVNFVSDFGRFITDFGGDIWVMGGSQTYALAMPFASELYLTKIDHDFNCDQFFPAYDDNFKLVSSDGPKQQNGLSFSYQVFRKDV